MNDELKELLRSAYQIAERGGRDTNWNAFHTAIQNCLAGDHADEQEILAKTCTARTFRIVSSGDVGGKTLHNSTVSGAKKNISDLKVFGNGDTFQLICKASSKAEGWMKSTKAMEIPGVGCVVQVTTQQGDNVAEAVCFVPGVKIELIDGDKMHGRKLVMEKIS